MRLHDMVLNFVLNFLLGIAWGFVFLGAFLLSYSFYLSYDNIPFTVMSVVFGMLPGLMAVVIIEHLITSKEKLAQLKEQTNLLQKLLNEKENILS